MRSICGEVCIGDVCMYDMMCISVKINVQIRAPGKCRCRCRCRLVTFIEIVDTFSLCVNAQYAFIVKLPLSSIVHHTVMYCVFCVAADIDLKVSHRRQKSYTVGLK